jgi:SAM-dependent methyltransferase
MTTDDRRPTTDDREPRTDHRRSATEDRGLKIEDSSLDASEKRSSILYPPSSRGEGGQWSVVGGRWSPFDALAAAYDRDFTDTLIGECMRRAVWHRFDAHFRPGMRVLELNCGTGTDALELARRGVHVLATDIAPAMLAVAREKIARAGLEHMIDLQQLDIETLRPDSSEDSIVNRKSSIVNRFDGMFSNFGGLNCVPDLRAVAAGLAACLQPGAPALLCIMGPLVPWEWAWYLRHGQPGKAFRRLRPGGVHWRGLMIRYPSPRAVRRAFAPWFRPRRTGAIGVLVPPSYAEGWAARHPRLLARLDRWERRLEALPPLSWLADHYLLELERL